MIFVAEGTYVESINFDGKDITVRSYDPDDPAVVAATIIDGGGEERVVTFTSGESRHAVLTGFTIQNGYAWSGGGIYCNNASPTISNNIIRDNYSIAYEPGGGGGGISISYGSRPLVTRNTIIFNEARYAGGAIYCYDGSPTIRENIIRNNTSQEGGGGIYCDEFSSPIIENKFITENTTSGGEFPHGGGICFGYRSGAIVVRNTISSNEARYGGGIYCDEGSSPYIVANTITGHDITGSGGGIYTYYADAWIADNVITGNSAYNGGGIFCGMSDDWIINNLIVGNVASRNSYNQGRGAGIYFTYDCDARLTNNTFAGNAASEAGGGIYTMDGSVTVTDCIFWGNAPQSIAVKPAEELPVVTFSCVEGGYGEPGDHNIDSDPLFVTGQEGEYYLQPVSPCVNAGSAEASEIYFYFFDGEWISVYMSELTTKIDLTLDDGVVDIGYHYSADPNFK